MLLELGMMAGWGLIFTSFMSTESERQGRIEEEKKRREIEEREYRKAELEKEIAAENARRAKEKTAVERWHNSAEYQDQIRKASTVEVGDVVTVSYYNAMKDIKVDYNQNRHLLGMKIGNAFREEEPDGRRCVYTIYDISKHKKSC